MFELRSTAQSEYRKLFIIVTPNPLQPQSPLAHSPFLSYHHHVQQRLLRRWSTTVLSPTGSTSRTRRLLSPGTTTGLPGSPSRLWTALWWTALRWPVPTSTTTPNSLCSTAGQGWRRRGMPGLSGWCLFMLLR